MSDSRPRPIKDARELVHIAELTSIDFYEVSGRRRDAPASEDLPEHHLRIRQRDSESEIEIRCDITVESPDAHFFVDAAARFVLSEPVEIPHAVMQEFIERVGLMTVFPFLREAVLETSARLGVGRAVLDLLKPGRVPVEPDSERNEATTAPEPT